MVVCLVFAGSGLSGAHPGFGAPEYRQMHSPPERKAQLAVKGDSRVVRAEDMQERDFGPRCYR